LACFPTLERDFLSFNKSWNKTKIPVRTNFSSQNPEEWFGEAEEIKFSTFMEHWMKNKEWSEDNEKKEIFYYLASLPMNKYFEKLMNDVKVPFYPSKQKKAGNLWIGNSGQITSVHYDFSTGDPGMDGFHAVIKGFFYSS